jgi:hypothetical protein
MTRRLAIVIQAAVRDAVETLQNDVDAMKKRLAGVSAGIEVAELRAAAMASQESGPTIH